MRTELFDYELPEELIAVRPPPERDGARLLVVGQPFEHRWMRELGEIVPSGALLVLNDTRVFRARLVGRRVPSGGRTELFLVRHLEDGSWLALSRPFRRLRAGSEIEFDGLNARVIECLSHGELRAVLSCNDGDVAGAIERVGHVPIPPYLKREDELEDKERYQTVFAEHSGSVAAPTAGLHLTSAMLGRLEERGVQIAKLTLHVGPGTFQPVTVDDLDQHAMHSEPVTVTNEVAEAVARARARSAPVVAVGTTVVRALEAAADPEREREVRAFSGETSLLIQPGYEFRVVDALLTNFHMPKSTLLALVAAFAGLDRIREAYQAAIRERYRFLSYGDAMWIPTRGK